MKKETSTKVFSCSFCEMLIDFFSQQLSLSMKGTKNCLYCRESSKYDIAVKTKYLVKINPKKTPLPRQIPGSAPVL